MMIGLLFCMAFVAISFSLRSPLETDHVVSRPTGWCARRVSRRRRIDGGFPGRSDRGDSLRDLWNIAMAIKPAYPMMLSKISIQTGMSGSLFNSKFRDATFVPDGGAISWPAASGRVFPLGL